MWAQQACRTGADVVLGDLQPRKKAWYKGNSTRGLRGNNKTAGESKQQGRKENMLPHIKENSIHKKECLKTTERVGETF